MKKRSLLIIVFGILSCVLIMDALIPEPLIGHDSNLLYTLGYRPPKHPKEPPNLGPAQPLSEPSTLLLLGIGALGLAAYLNYKSRKNKN